MELHSERGTVTAELAIAMPAVLILLVFSMQALSVQVERIRLISHLSQEARAVARGENSVEKITFEGKLVCVQKTISNLWNVTEKQCARAIGL